MTDDEMPAAEDVDEAAAGDADPGEEILDPEWLAELDADYAAAVGPVVDELVKKEPPPEATRT